MISTLRIKNMVCARCRRVITEDLTSLGLRVIDVQLGEAVVEHTEPLPLASIQTLLRQNGFDLVEDKNTALVEQVKQAIIDLIQNGEWKNMPLKISDHIENITKKDYRYVSTVFSQTAGITIEKFVIAQKIERVKELLVYDEMSLSDIAFELGYSSVAYLSNQFKQETSQTPTAFKRDAVNARKGVENIGS
jgi:AraC family transcriptional regulator